MQQAIYHADEVFTPPESPGQPAGAVERMQHVFHELHAAGRNALCGVCDGQYGNPAR